MNKTTLLAALGKAFPCLWRAALALLLAAVLIPVGNMLLLDAILNGPSDSASAALALSLLEDPATAHIPARHLGSAAVSALTAPILADLGVTDPAQIHPSGSGTDRTETCALARCTAVVTVTAEAASLPRPWPDTVSLADGVLVLETPLSDTIDGGVALIVNGKCNEALLKYSGYAPRTAIGQCADGTFVIVTTDGGSRSVPGATYRDILNLMTRYGAVNACLLPQTED